MGGLKYYILATYAAQIFQICFYSAPSAGSTLEMLFKLKKDPKGSRQHPAAAAMRSRPKVVMLVLATLAVTITSLIPLITIIHPPVFRLLLPVMSAPNDLMTPVCILLLVLGNVLTYIAVATLRSHVSFHEFGETTRLHTAGIYGYLRNPITVGLALIYAGFFLALPSAVMLIGLIFFLVNSNYRIKMEEIYLQRAFGDDYTRYRQQVSKFFPLFRMMRYFGFRFRN